MNAEQRGTGQMGTLLSIRLSPEQTRVHETYRRTRGWTRTHMFEEMAREYFTARGIDWPVNDTRISA